MMNLNVAAFRNRTRFASIEALRGLASLAVAWYHFTHGNHGFLPAGPVRSSGTYGWLGVEVFFVVSGFVIPYSLWRSDYRLCDFGRFLGKRVTRLDPPYFAAVAMIIVLGWVSAHVPGYRGAPFAIAWKQIALHAGYLNVFFGGDAGRYPWLSPVFWTLAIEFQFYLSMGVFYPLLTNPNSNRSTVLMIAVGLVGAAIVPSPSILMHYAPLFLTGITVFQYRVGVIRRSGAAFALMSLAIAAAALLGPAIAIVGLLTGLAIVGFETSDGIVHRMLSFLGTISYSLYLVHVPVGGRVINLGVRYAHSAPARWAFLVAAVVTSIVTAWAFARLIERPAQRLASRLPMHHRPELVGRLKREPSAVTADLTTAASAP